MNKKGTGWNLDNSYLKLPKSFFSRMSPNPVREPKLVILNRSLAASLGFDIEELQSKENIMIFAGNALPDGSSSLAQAYAGHQFGHFTMLGDGRAMLIGEQITPQEERLDIQLKGSGRTTYSRGGDGRAALGPMLREYIISEAMYGLEIPTTRSLAVVTSGESIARETYLPGAILTRVAASHIRVGTFQYASKMSTPEDLKILADYTIRRHYPAIETDTNRYLSFLLEVIKCQAKLIAKWQLVGFIHGVMNTDNMTISGETIDYGPCAFMDTYNPATVFSSIDRSGRYAYGNQPYIASWNLARFAETLLPLLHENEEQALEMAQHAMADFSKLYQSDWLLGMRAKLGLFNEEEQDEILVKDLLALMEKYQADFTNTFRFITLDRIEDTILSSKNDFKHWYERWQARRGRQQETEDASRQLMRKSNPAVIPRNHLVEEALDAAVNKGDYHVMDQLLNVLSNPYDYSEKMEKYCETPVPTSQPYRTFCGT
ncbi:uncharacterized protein YdiU (UPF0061 family) [Cytobacillus eiseniae]|uniref:Protein nucleotidyltransferase YdiU n=1 Tax=Cytobacillus eiseniae TaxID=762947 RepID=A0ABS4RAC1_9BACI|nr:YdiU family protein [Cytobacillus eiseniae]MBP2239629.1 uncharacterized protein YdiU (UPF0061 family) [Cytobacillus eiseniae]